MYLSLREISYLFKIKLKFLNVLFYIIIKKH